MTHTQGRRTRGRNKTASDETLAEALDHMLDYGSLNRSRATVACYRSKARRLREALGGVELNCLRIEMLAEYIVTRLHTVTRHTVHKELTVLRVALQWAQSRGVFKGSLTIIPPLSADYRPRTRWLTVSELERMLGNLPVDRHLWVLLAAYAGAAPSKEIESITWEDVDLDGGWLLIRGEKTRARWRNIPIAQPLRAWLHEDHLPVKPWPECNRHIRAACRASGVAEIAPTDLRRTFCSWLKQAGVDSLTASKLMGHSTTRMVDMVYGQLSQDTYRDAVATLPVMARGLKAV